MMTILKITLTLTGLAAMFFIANTFAVELLAMNDDCKGDCGVKTASEELNPAKAVEDKTNSREIAQAVTCDPNEKLGINPRIAMFLCKFSYSDKKQNEGTLTLTSLPA
jgi:hypothetical protein